MSEASPLVPKWAITALVLGFGFSVFLFLGVSIDPVDYLFTIGKAVANQVDPSTAWYYDFGAMLYTIYGITVAALFIITKITKGTFTGIAAVMFFFGGFMLIPAAFIGAMFFMLGIIPAAIGKYREEDAYD